MVPVGRGAGAGDSDITAPTGALSLAATGIAHISRSKTDMHKVLICLVKRSNFFRVFIWILPFCFFESAFSYMMLSFYFDNITQFD